MQTLLSYINGQWIRPQGSVLAVRNPANNQAIAQVILGTEAELELAVSAAVEAFETYSQTSLEQRIHYLEQLRAAYAARLEEIAEAIRLEMGAPQDFALNAQAASGLAHFDSHLQALREFAFEYPSGASQIVHEPIGVVGLITPWNWPMNQLVVKVIPALAAGCTLVLKPSELAPLSANLFAEIIQSTDLPTGVFNLLHGDGEGVGQELVKHPQVDMISFTGSTRAGKAITKAAADTIKRVTLELGGKSPNLILDDADLEQAIQQGVLLCMSNSGQSCDAPTRMYLPRPQYHQAIEIAKNTAVSLVVGDPKDANTNLGPVISQTQYDRIQALIQAGIDEGASLICGGLGKPKHLRADLVDGHYVQATLFAKVHQQMRIAREEIFGPVLVMLPYDSEQELIEMANDSPYGLSAYISSTNRERALRIARQLRAGQVQLNYPEWDLYAPFGGYKQSGNGREYAQWGLRDFLETKAIIG
ncbi:aldehyde dehydrogenase family protein [uncultured Thiothrix sp.]|uniref:aldehyde dehydrogenase family protein n=1 Tax=uncultured Thiothrix sp. TaxID=223185 RepID=UPI002624AA28|nr:aldehyde dehydrogenase family protein [uncultured Thiothrix sp.]